MWIIYILFHNCKYSRKRNLSSRHTRNVIKCWWAFWIPLCVRGCAWVKEKPSWKKKYPAKSNFITSCLQSDCVFHCFMLLVWWGFFWRVYHQYQKLNVILLTTVVGWFFYVQLSWHSHLPNHSTAIAPSIYCQTQHFWKNITQGFCIQLQFHYMTANSNMHLISVKETANSVVQTILKSFLQICDITVIQKKKKKKKVVCRFRLNLP